MSQYMYIFVLVTYIDYLGLRSVISCFILYTIFPSSLAVLLLIIMFVFIYIILSLYLIVVL